jgi:hypothetical protein
MTIYKTRKTQERKGLRNHYLYGIWSDIKKRCLNKDAKNYKNYGGRGIGISDEWQFFSNFLADMGDRPDGYQLDRIDNDKGYSKENCRWVSRSQNCANRRVHNKNNTHPRGVIKKGSKYIAKIKINGIRYIIGNYDCMNVAHEEYVKVFKEWFGQEPIS